MRFSVPKPLHGWPDFLHEIVIIVLGVLLALGLEQLISSFNDRTSAAETRSNIRGELADNLRLLLRRERTGDCVEHRLQEIAAFLDSSSRGEHPPQPSWIGAPYAPLAADTAFKSAQNAGKFFLLPQGEQQKFQAFYVDSDDFNEQSTREWYDWAQLRSLTSSLPLTDSEITRLRQALQDARGSDRLIRVDVVDYARLAGEGGIIAHDHQVPPEKLTPACLPINMPFAEASARSAGTIPGNLL
jgi:hypothetical protein